MRETQPMVPEHWETSRVQSDDVRSDEVDELRAVIGSAREIAPLDPTFRPEERSGMVALVEASRAGGDQFQMQALRLRGERAIIGYWHCRRIDVVPDVLALGMFVLTPP